MKSADELFEAVVLTILFAIMIALAFGTARADASPVALTHYQGARIDRAAPLTLARMVCGETGPDDLDAAAAQVGVIARRASARGVSLSTMASQYSAALRRPQRPWVLALAATRRRQDGFPRGASWRRYQLRFERLLKHIEAQLDGNVKDPCEVEAPDHFGSLHLDGHRARRAGWERVCADVGGRQAFWRSR